MKVVVESIGPERASELLKLNKGNFRKINHKKVAEYAADQSSGNWELNGETIKVNGDVLKDGQHRLLAIVKSGATIKTAVAYDVDSQCIHVDEGMKRKVSDWIRHEGLLNASVMCAIARLVLCHNKRRWNWNEPDNTFVGKEEIVEYCVMNDVLLQQAIKTSRRTLHPRIGVRHSIIAAVLYLGSRENATEESDIAGWFLDKLVSGEELTKNDPVYHLREQAILSMTSPVKRWTPEHERALVCIAWNKTVSGEVVKQLKVAGTGPAKQKIPYVINEGDKSWRE